MAPSGSTDSVTVVWDRDELEALLGFIPVDKLAYTPAGERAYGAYQALQQALHPEVAS